MIYKRSILGAAVLGGVALAWILVELATRPAPSAAPSRVVARASASPAAAATPAAVRAAAPASASAALVPAASIEDEVMALVRSGTPENFLKAYQAVEQCMALERSKDVVKRVDVKWEHGEAKVNLTKADAATVDQVRARCESLTGMTRRTRHEYLKRAYEGRAYGAMSLYLFAGPEGDAEALKIRPGDPAVQAWKADLRARIKEGLQAGEEESMESSIIATHVLGTDLPIPVATYVDLVLIDTITSQGKPLPDFLASIRDSLSPEHRALAQSELDTILGAWRKRKQKAGSTI